MPRHAAGQEDVGVGGTGSKGVATGGRHSFARLVQSFISRGGTAASLKRNLGNLKRATSVARLLQRPRTVSVQDALRIIERNDLRPASGAWHYSWDIDRFCETMIVHETAGAMHVYAPRPLNEWAPVAHYTNCAHPLPLRTGKTEPLPFWFLELTTFDDFLARRSALSKQPSAHFPTRETFESAARRMRCHLEHFPLPGREELFCALYDRLKHSKYGHSGRDCLSSALNANTGVPPHWFQICTLVHDETGQCHAVQLGIHDHRSCSGINAGSERRSGVGYGIFLDVLITRYLCAAGRSSFDCGVSGDYGGYKRKIFLDAMQTVVTPKYGL